MSNNTQAIAKFHIRKSYCLINLAALKTNIEQLRIIEIALNTSSHFELILRKSFFVNLYSMVSFGLFLFHETYGLEYYMP